MIVRLLLRWRYDKRRRSIGIIDDFHPNSEMDFIVMNSKVSFLSGIALPLIIAAGCASEPSAPGAVVVADNDPERIICHNDAPIGSRLPKRVCKSAREWDAIAEEAKEDGRNLRRGAVSAGEASAVPGN